MLATEPWRINNTKEWRQHIIHPLGNFSKILPRWGRGGFLCLLKIRKNKRKRKKKKRQRKKIWASWQLPSQCITHTAITPTPLGRHSRKCRQARSQKPLAPSHTPTTSESAHQADNHGGNWAQPKPSSPTAHHFLGYQLPNAEGLHRGEANDIQTHSIPSCIENMVLVGAEILLTNISRGLAAGEDPATGNSFVGPFLKHEMPEALARFQLATLKPRAMLAHAWVKRQTECRHYWERWAVYEEEENGDSARNSKEQSSPRELGARLCGMGSRQK